MCHALQLCVTRCEYASSAATKRRALLLSMGFPEKERDAEILHLDRNKSETKSFAIYYNKAMQFRNAPLKFSRRLTPRCNAPASRMTPELFKNNRRGVKHAADEQG